MTTTENRSERENELVIRIAQGDELSPVEMLEFYDLRIQTLSSQLPSGGVIIQESLDTIREQREVIRLEIMNSGDIGGPINGHTIRNDDHSPHH